LLDLSHYGARRTASIVGKVMQEQELTFDRQVSGMWPAIAAILMVGYLSLSRAFAYLGIPWWKIFIGEAVLAMLFFSGPKFNGRSWPRAFLELPVLKRVCLLYGLFLAYGIVQIVHGILAGNPPLVAVRDLTFNYYPIYFFLGLSAGLMRPDLLPKLLRGFAWFNGLYGVLYIFVLNQIDWFVPGVSDEIARVPIFGQPIYSFVALLGLIVYEKDLWRSAHLLGLNLFVMLGMQFRTEWFAFAVGIITWLLVSGQGKRLLQVTAIFVAVFCLMYITNFSVPGPEGRGGGDISIRQLTDRAIAPFRADTSNANVAAGIGADSQESTFVWRTVWWLMIWNAVHSNTNTTVWGLGYGYPLGDLAPYLAGEFIRTPHNVFFYALGYTGWIGVVLFFLFEAEILRLLWQVNRKTRDPFGVPFWASMMAYGMFFPLGETPYGAIPFYLIVGWIAAPVLLESQPLQLAQYVPAQIYFPHASASGSVTAAP
jgi:hypothetical protein